MATTTSTAENRRFRSDCDVYLVVPFTQRIMGSKLPSKRQVLQVLFYNIRAGGLNLKDAARLALDEVDIFWRKVRIPTQKSDRCDPMNIEEM